MLPFAASLLLLLSCSCWPSFVLSSADSISNSKIGLPIESKTVKNDRPIVGVLLLNSWDNQTQYASSSNVKWAEMAGARVVLIPVGRSRAYYSALYDQINGVILPGGGALLVGSPYADAVEIILQTAEAKFAAGIHWPVWAICLSFEKLIAYYSGNSLAWMRRCEVRRVSLPLDFPVGLDLGEVRLLREAPSGLIELLRGRNVTANYHSICLDVETFQGSANLSSHFRLVSTNRYLPSEQNFADEPKGERAFVSTIEHRRLPIYGVQWHPEKASFEWSDELTGFAHDEAAITVGQYFANFFVGEARRNGQRFASVEEERRRLVYGHSAGLHYSPDNIYQETYVFDRSGPESSYNGSSAAAWNRLPILCWITTFLLQWRRWL